MTVAARTSIGTGAEAPDRRPRYLVNPIVDALAVGLGSIAVYVLFRTRPGWAGSASVPSIAATLVWFANYPHFAATNHRLYHRRQNIAQYPATALAVPIIVVAGMAAAFASPVTIAPAFVLLYQVWSPYHFSGQTVGVTMVYARRTGFPVGGRLRWALGAFVFATFARQLARFAVSAEPFAFYGVGVPGLGIPAWVATVTNLWMWSTGCALVALAVLTVVNERRPVPMIVALPAVAQYVWFAATPAGLFFYLVPFFHSVQYLLIAWTVHASERRPARRGLELARWFSTNLALGGILFWGLPRVGVAFGRSLAFSTAVVFAGVQIHHFFVDGVIWRLRHASVQQTLTGTVPR